MKIAVIIITYNAKQWIEKCIAPLAKPSVSNSVYIIDNGSIDGTQEIIQKYFPEFVFHQSQTNLGFGKANNLGLSMALKDGADYFLLLNQDAFLSWDNISSLADILSHNKNYGILSPLQLFDKMNVDYLHYKNLLVGDTGYFNDLIVNNKIKDLYEIYYTNAAICMISKECLKEVGGFDPLFPHYGEDSEYAKRLSFFKFKFGLCPNIKGYHYRKQNIERVLDVKMLFNIFLVKLKDLNVNIFKNYIIIFVKVFLGFIGNYNRSQKSRFSDRLKAFLYLFLLFSRIKKNRRKHITNKYVFLKYN